MEAVDGATANKRMCEQRIKPLFPRRRLGVAQRQKDAFSHGRDDIIYVVVENNQTGTWEHNCLVQSASAVECQERGFDLLGYHGYGLMKAYVD